MSKTNSKEPSVSKIEPVSVRIDIWLWAARFFKTRQLAIDAVNLNRVMINSDVVKPARHVRVGDVVSLRRPPFETIVNVLGVSEVRGGAPIAQSLYSETPESIQKRTELNAQLKAAGPPLLKGRPTKRDRRDLERVWQANELNARDD
jgi:ribosome-associated heat shock protein Hsp15